MRRFLLALALVLFAGGVHAQIHPTPSTTDVPWILNGNLTGVIATTGARLTAETKSGVSADQIIGWVFCTSSCLPLPNFGGGNYDAIRGIGIANANSTTPIIAGVSGYVQNNVVATAGVSSVALFGAGVVNIDGGSVWGVNTNVSDHPFRSAQVGTHTRRITGAEFDVSASYPDTNVTGILVAGNSVVQPTTNANAISVVGQDFSATVPGSIAKWSSALTTYDNVASHVIFAGAACAHNTGTQTCDTQNIQSVAFVSGVSALGEFGFGPGVGGSNTCVTCNAGTYQFEMNYGLNINTGGLIARTTTDQLIQLGGNLDLASGALIESRNDANSVLKPLEILASTIFLNGTIQVGTVGTFGAQCTAGVTGAATRVVNGIVTVC
jgi:hypothetical protein